MFLNNHIRKHHMHYGILLIFVAGLFLTAGDLILRSWVAEPDTWRLYVLGVVLYFIALNFLARSYRFENIAIASVIMEVFNLVTYLAISYWKFGDTLSRLEITGIILGIAAIACFELG